MFDFFMEFYRCRKEVENLSAYAYERHFKINSCSAPSYPSKDLARRFGMRGNIMYPEIWAAVEHYYNSMESHKAAPDELQPKQ